MAEEDFDLSIERTPDGVVLHLKTASYSADVLLDSAQAMKFRQQDVEGDVTQLAPALHAKPLFLSWGAFGDGDLTLNIFLGGLRPLGLVLTDPQAHDVAEGLSKCLRIPRELRIAKTEH
jgi:hypothetical protein